MLPRLQHMDSSLTFASKVMITSIVMLQQGELLTQLIPSPPFYIWVDWSDVSKVFFAQEQHQTTMTVHRICNL